MNLFFGGGFGPLQNNPSGFPEKQFSIAVLADLKFKNRSLAMLDLKKINIICFCLLHL